MYIKIIQFCLKKKILLLYFIINLYLVLYLVNFDYRHNLKKFKTIFITMSQ